MLKLRRNLDRIKKNLFPGSFLLTKKIAQYKTDDITTIFINLKNDLNQYKKYGKISFYTQSTSFENNVVNEKGLIATNRYISEHLDYLLNSSIIFPYKDI